MTVFDLDINISSNFILATFLILISNEKISFSFFSENK